jgi:hypothetical protein
MRDRPFQLFPRNLLNGKSAEWNVKGRHEGYLEPLFFILIVGHGIPRA